MPVWPCRLLLCGHADPYHVAMQVSTVWPCRSLLCRPTGLSCVTKQVPYISPNPPGGSGGWSPTDFGGGSGGAEPPRDTRGPGPNGYSLQGPPKGPRAQRAFRAKGLSGQGPKGPLGPRAQRAFRAKGPGALWAGYTSPPPPPPPSPRPPGPARPPAGCAGRARNPKGPQVTPFATKWVAVPPFGTLGPGSCAEFRPGSRRGGSSP